MKWNGTGAFVAGRLPGRQRPARRAQLRARGRAPDRGQPQHVRHLLLLCDRSPALLSSPLFHAIRRKWHIWKLERCCVFLPKRCARSSALLSFTLLTSTTIGGLIYSLNLQIREYLPMGGSIKMIEESLKLAYGEDSDFIKDKRIAAVQALSGTGACRLFADFQKRFLPDSQIYIPTPTWSKWVDLAVTPNFIQALHRPAPTLKFVWGRGTVNLNLCNIDLSCQCYLLTPLYWFIMWGLLQPSQYLEGCSSATEDIHILPSRVKRAWFLRIDEWNQGGSFL